eukprot:TRINITY_DN14835_c0_g1::TRINITY_DN14835_c0_g1_i1::g.16256::m.16256 TRINITY_DN14835_c0_g1::TRINITY_DN14835_c0_g1_i1::g.16256  ORF type:complete len:227 (+),score=8.11,zf-C2H2_4/PF13894.1/0.00015,zf-C2H2/PF00096.21/0.0016,TALPID3/PF15324.1/0.021,zf-H2C2_2/PF13465.1/0.65,zf-H2C2_2/PF13465.1/2.2e+03 TRINITY_DN14835_c0_g1_i1:210-890(+)
MMARGSNDQALAAHASHTGRAKIFICPEIDCGKSFTTNWSRSRHLQSIHGKSKETIILKTSSKPQGQGSNTPNSLSPSQSPLIQRTSSGFAEPSPHDRRRKDPDAQAINAALDSFRELSEYDTPTKRARHSDVFENGDRHHYGSPSHDPTAYRTPDNSPPSTPESSAKKKLMVDIGFDSPCASPTNLETRYGPITPNTKMAAQALALITAGGNPARLPRKLADETL